MTSEMQIADALQAARDPQSFGQRYDEIISTLETHECWDEWFHVVRAHMKTTPDDLISDYCRLVKTYLLYVEDVEAAATCCREALEARPLAYREFRRLVVDRVIEAEDFATEGVLLRTIWDKFQAREDKIEVLERLCFIYEKKSHNDTLLHQYYEKLRKIHPENSKALRYFRTLYSQMQDWVNVVDVLKRLLASAKHPQETFRYAQELAAVFLYQLDDPREAVRYIEEYCANSTLDTSTIHYEAYYRLNNLDGCLQVLRSCLSGVENPETRAIIHYRIAALFEQLGRLPEAFDHFQKTLELSDNFLEAIEGLISTAIKQRNWSVVRDWLSVLAGKTKSPSLASQIRAGVQRLEEGLKYAASGR